MLSKSLHSPLVKGVNAKQTGYVILFFLRVLSHPLSAQDKCEELLAAWERVESYQCFYRAITFYEGKKSVTEMRYTFQKPNKVRMDIIKPQNGAVVIYNPAVSKKVRVRPYPALPFFVLNYDLTHRKVKADSGATIADSHLGERIKDYCSSTSLKKNENLELTIDSKSQLPEIIEISSPGKNERFEWLELKINPELNPEIFVKF